MEKSTRNTEKAGKILNLADIIKIQIEEDDEPAIREMMPEPLSPEEQEPIIDLDYEWDETGTFLIPKMEVDPEPEEPLTKYGHLRMRYLREHRRGRYSGLLMSGKLKTHCLEIQKEAEAMEENLVKQMAELIYV